MKLILITILVCLELYGNGFLDSDEKGWFWGEEPIKIEDTNTTKKKKPKQKKESNKITYHKKKYKRIDKKVDIPFQILDELDPDEINKMELKNRKISLMYPTTENITKYKLLQYYIAQKAKKFASASSDVMRQNPQLANWVASMPTKHIALDVNARDKENKKLKTIKSFKDKAIILVATEPSCPYCKREIPILNEFVSIYKMQYKNINISAYREFGRKYGVEKTPTLFLLYNNNGKPKITRIATGLQAMNNIEQAVLFGLYTFKLINKDLL